jgi:hypothetical protein
MLWVALPMTYEKWRHPSTKQKHYRVVFSNGKDRRVSKTKIKRAGDVAEFVDRYNRICSRRVHAVQRSGDQGA